MPLPLLTWTQRAIYSNGGGTTVEAFLDNLIAYLATPGVPSWGLSVKSSNTGYDPGDGSSVSYVELQFVTNPGDESFYILLAGSDSGATTAPVDDVIFDDNSAHNYAYNKNTGQIYIGIAPHGGTLTAANLWTGTSQPYDKEWSRLFRMTDWSNIDNFWIVDSAEQAVLCWDVSSQIQGVFFGQGVAPLGDDAGYQIDSGGKGRVPIIMSFNRSNERMINNWRGGYSGQDAHPGWPARALGDKDHNAFSYVFDNDDTTNLYRNTGAVNLGPAPLVRAQGSSEA